MPFLSEKRLFYYLILIVFSLNANAQIRITQSSTGFWEQVRYGGNVGLGFGDGFFSGTLAPSAVYEFNDRIALGVGLNATYNNQKNLYKSTVFGGSLIGLFNPIPEIQLSAEFEELNVNRKWNTKAGYVYDNYWYPALFLGAGYRSSNVAVGMRYDLLYDRSKSIYVKPWTPFVRLYF
ncbi:MAG TPA: hypothetical protein VNJ50_03040 [Gelidibacter sp.]|uniref:alpha-ketoglutarate decarboxylase n=1 Tax=Gelidibacter sp. TaxID=2018083 RepID=UPI002C483B76|nr:alpha-ketoglutarate decarboxylase [Gelidibacter sp.]HXJ97798.1 hypothetical protein [Gelidibacter sp.]